MPVDAYRRIGSMVLEVGTDDQGLGAHGEYNWYVTARSGETYRDPGTVAQWGPFNSADAYAFHDKLFGTFHACEEYARTFDKLVKKLDLERRPEHRMHIPLGTMKPRFYVAISDIEAFSSWDTLEKAMKSIERLQAHYPKEADNIIGIVETGPTGRKILHKLGEGIDGQE